KIIEAADQSTGGHTRVSGFDFHLGTLTAHLYGVELRGTEPAGSQPLLRVDKITVGLKIRSVVHHTVNIGEVLIEHPVLQVQVDREGEATRPEPPQSQPDSHTDIFDLAIGHLSLTHGEIGYNDRKANIGGDLYGLKTDVTFDSLARCYRGKLSY